MTGVGAEPVDPFIDPEGYRAFIVAGEAGVRSGRPYSRTASAASSRDQKSTCTLNRMNRGRSTAVGCIHRAPLVAGSYTVSYVVGVLTLNRL